eukprot:2279741-Pyramimonas_sp.AAC.1
MVFQGTLLGPVLWNAFYSDSKEAVRSVGFQGIIFADDLNAFKVLVRDETNAEAYAAMHECQNKLHSWGHANGIVFDASEESMRILSHSRPHGDSFLGVTFDSKLLMGDAISECACEAGWRS